MKIAIFSSKAHDEKYLADFLAPDHEGVFLKARLQASTAGLATGYKAVCAFVTDRLDRECLQVLSDSGTQFIALRCAGFNTVDL